MAKGGHSTVRVDGLKELTRAFKAMDKDLSKEVTKELKKVAEPVKGKAQDKALDRISHMTTQWATMRVGVSKAKGVVYIQPASRGRSHSRPNLAGLLMGRAMWPAVDEAQPEVISGLEQVIDKLGSDNGF